MKRLTPDLGGVAVQLVALVLMMLWSETVAAQTPSSDDFNAPVLDPIWTFIDPLGDSGFQLVGSGSDDAQLLLTVPPGVAHEPSVPNQTARVMQSVSDVDFEVEVKFESGLSGKQQRQGLLIEEDADTYLRFDFFSKNAILRIGAFRTDGASATEYIKLDITQGGTLYLRVLQVDGGAAWSSPFFFE